MAVLERVVVDGLAQGAVPPGYTHTRSTTGLYIDSDGLLKSAAINTPRRQWDAANRRWGYVGEPGRTNECLQSSTFSSGTWSKTNTTVTASYADGPDGSLTASRVQLGATIGAKIDQPVALTTGTASKTVTHQVWMKSSTGASQSVQVKNTHGGVLDNYSTVTVTTDWQRFSLTVTNSASAGTGSQLVGIYNHEAVAKDLLVWHQQTEQAPYPSSPIPTTTVAVSRGADLLTRALTAGEGTALSAQGTMVVEFSFLGGDSTVTTSGRPALVIDGSSGAERAWIYNNAGAVGGFIRAGSVSQATPLVAGTAAVGVVQKCALTWKADDVQFARNGSHGTRDVAATMPALTAIGIGSDSAGAVSGNVLVYGWTIYDDHYPTDAGMDAITLPTVSRNSGSLRLGLGLGL